MFAKYKHIGSWSESLHIFLFAQLIIKRTNIEHLTIEQYQQFELRDADIFNFNKWIDLGCPAQEVLIEWIKANSKQVEDFKNLFGSTFKPKVEIWSDRQKTDYYKEKLQASFEFENYLEGFFRDNYGLELGQYLTPEGQYYQGENELGIEIKNDMLIRKYGNIYFEYAEKSKATNHIFVNSGILKNDKSRYFIIGDRDKFWVFRKKRLVEIYHEEQELRRQNKPSARGIHFKEKPTSLGFVYPILNADKEAISLEVLVSEIKSNK